MGREGKGRLTSYYFSGGTSQLDRAVWIQDSQEGSVGQPPYFDLGSKPGPTLTGRQKINKLLGVFSEKLAM